MKTALLTDGTTITYDVVVRREETHPRDRGARVVMYTFTRGTLGVVYVCAERRVAKLEAK